MTESSEEMLVSCATILADLFSDDPAEEKAKVLVEGLVELDLVADWPFGDEASLANAQQQLAAGAADPEGLRDEWKRLFVMADHFEAPQWASVYLDPDEVIFGNAHLALAQWMRHQGISVESSSQSREPMDSFGNEMALLAWIAENRPELLGEYLDAHLLPWSFRYLDLLEEHAHHPFWQGSAVLARTTLQSLTPTGVSA